MIRILGILRTRLVTYSYYYIFKISENESWKNAKQHELLEYNESILFRYHKKEWGWDLR
jgi:hypothetical protein